MTDEQKLAALQLAMRSPITSLHIEGTNLTSYDCEFRFVVNKGTDTEVVIDKEVLLETVTLGVLLEETRRGMARLEAELQGRHGFEPRFRCALCGWGPEQNKDRVESFVRVRAEAMDAKEERREAAEKQAARRVLN
jgi:hypothetical protein